MDRKALLAGCFGGLVGVVLGIGGSEASLSRQNENPTIQIKNDFQNYKKEQEQRNTIKKNLRFSYEEWKAAIENPQSQEAENLRKKARFIGDYPEITRLLLDGEEKEKYEQFWKHFTLDVKKLFSRINDPNATEIIFNYALPCILEMQVDIDKTFAPIEAGIDVRRFFDYSNLNEGQKILIYWHFTNEGRYLANGGKRDTTLFKSEK